MQADKLLFKVASHRQLRSRYVLRLHDLILRCLGWRAFHTLYKVCAHPEDLTERVVVTSAARRHGNFLISACLA